MSDLTKIGPPLLEMDDIAQYLNLGKGFITDKDKASDVKQIAGVDADLIAVAVDKSDRTTVRNALNLNGHDDTYFLTADEGADLVAQNKREETAYNAEIKELRDEVYQLREELAKAGMTVRYRPYAGFYDTFKSAYPEHEIEAVATSVENSSDQYTIIVQDSLYDEFAIGDKIMLKNLESDKNTIVTIDNKLADLKTIHFTPASGFPIKKDKCVIHKSKGNLINGTFTFGEIVEERPGDKEFYSCLDDDTFRSRRKIDAGHKGFGYTFRIPAIRQKNYLAGLDIQVKKYGTPGDLMCYVIDERNILNWKNAQKAEDDGIIIAKSQPLEVDMRLGEHLANFNFYDGNTYPLLKDVDTTDHKIRYCFIIEALDADDKNYYEILFLQHKQADGTYGDLQLNNITYYYNAQDDQSLDDALITDKEINSTDIYYGITLKEALQKTFVPYTDGIYSAKFETHEPVRISHARLAMRIGREGIFKISADGTSYNKNNNCVGDNSVIVVEGETTDDVKGFVRSKDKNIVIGTEIRKLANQDNERLTVEKGVYAKPELPVYPIGYTVSLKANLKTWDAKRCGFVYSKTKRFRLALREIMPDYHKKDDAISDRLIFESDLTNDNLEVDPDGTDTTLDGISFGKWSIAPDAQDNLRIAYEKKAVGAFRPPNAVDNVSPSEFNIKDYIDTMKAEAIGEYEVFNNFEIQIQWEYSANAVSQRIYGSIHDLVVSLDRLP